MTWLDAGLLVWAVLATWAALRYRAVVIDALRLLAEAHDGWRDSNEALIQASAMIESIQQAIRTPPTLADVRRKDRYN